jgi:hypothetical protein
MKKKYFLVCTSLVLSAQCPACFEGGRGHPETCNRGQRSNRGHPGSDLISYRGGRSERLPSYHIEQRYDVRQRGIPRREVRKNRGEVKEGSLWVKLLVEVIPEPGSEVM